jgi:4'-phosphopantetheinyl transferase
MTELWLVDLERTAPALEALDGVRSVRSPDDRARARRIADPAERRRRIAAYAALRVILERIAGPGVRGVDFVRSADGKPSLAGGYAAFSLSHSDAFALIGVTRHGEIGVDLEQTRAIHMSLRRRQLIIAAASGLADAPLGDDADDQVFLRAWSRLEAFAKARAGGLARLLEDVGVRGRHHDETMTHAEAEVAARRLVENAGLKVCDVKLSRGLYGAVALKPATSVPRVRAFPVEAGAIERLLEASAAKSRMP